MGDISDDPRRWVADAPLPASFNPSNYGFRHLPIYGCYPNGDPGAYTILAQAFISGSRTYGYQLELFDTEYRLACYSPVLSRPGSFVQITPLDHDLDVCVSITYLKPVISDSNDNFDLVYEPGSVDLCSSVSANRAVGFSMTAIAPAGSLITSIVFTCSPVNPQSDTNIHLLVQSSATPISDLQSAASQWSDYVSVDVPKTVNVTYSDIPDDIGAWLLTACSGFLNAPIFGHFSIGGLIATILGISLLWFLLHLWM